MTVLSQAIHRLISLVCEEPLTKVRVRLDSYRDYHNRSQHQKLGWRGCSVLMAVVAGISSLLTFVLSHFHVSHTFHSDLLLITGRLLSITCWDHRSQTKFRIAQAISVMKRRVFFISHQKSDVNLYYSCTIVILDWHSMLRRNTWQVHMYFCHVKRLLYVPIAWFHITLCSTVKKVTRYTKMQVI